MTVVAPLIIAAARRLAAPGTGHNTAGSRQEWRISTGGADLGNRGGSNGCARTRLTRTRRGSGTRGHAEACQQFCFHMHTTRTGHRWADRSASLMWVRPRDCSYPSSLFFPFFLFFGNNGAQNLLGIEPQSNFTFKVSSSHCYLLCYAVAWVHSCRDVRSDEKYVS